MIDFKVHLRICLEREAVQDEFQVMLAGGSGAADENLSSQPQVISSRKLPSGATVETTKEKPMKFQGSIKPVRVNKEGQYIGDA